MADTRFSFCSPRDPSLRLKTGSAQDDADLIEMALRLRARKKFSTGGNCSSNLDRENSQL